VCAGCILALYAYYLSNLTSFTNQRSLQF
jgi:hypothetical protein